MENRISTRVPGLIYQAELALPGVVANEVPMALVMVKGDSFALSLAELKDGRDVHAAAKVEARAKRNALDGVVGVCRRFGMTAKGVVNVYLGSVHTEAHEAAGFVGGFEVPRKYERLLRLLQGLKTHFTANPTHENAGLNITAARATTLINDLTNALAAVNQQKSKVRDTMIVRDGFAFVMRTSLRALFGELRVKLDPLGSKWEEFGFKRPGALAIPEVPENVIVVSSVQNAVSVKWDAAERAKNYRVWKKVVGVDEDFVAVESLSHVECILQGLPAGATVQIAVSATNNGGESARSAVVTVVTA
jgi:hypothetical protein